MIVVDTSVWIAAERNPRGEDAERLRGLLKADEVALALPVRIELVAGIAAKNRKALRRRLTSLPIVRPTRETWNLLESWVPRATDAGHHFNVADLLIGALAEELGALIWSHDTHFVTMEKLKFVHLYAPPARKGA